LRKGNTPEKKKKKKIKAKNDKSGEIDKQQKNIKKEEAKNKSKRKMRRVVKWTRVTCKS
jgi:hypothetical protein